jgi:4-hydroxyacetophenone monooxygenase
VAPADTRFRGTDSELRSAAAGADLPALLAALAMLTGDDALLDPGLEPSHEALGATVPPQGGMTPRAQRAARELAVRVLARYRDGEYTGRPRPGAGWRRRVIRFLTGLDEQVAAPGELSLLEHELDPAAGDPGWRLEQVAPGASIRVAVIGAGLSGLAAAHRLVQAGVPVDVFEENEDLGGTWWHNTYPGARLDTANFAYGFSFAPKADWPHQFSTQPEIHAYLRELADRLDLRRHIRFRASVRSLAWDDEAAMWVLRVTTPDAGEVEHRANMVITAVGMLNRPNIPDLPGLNSFGGPAFHSARWNHTVDLAGQRVAVIGTGASAFQIVPAIAGDVASVTVFQRQPPWLLPTPAYLEPTSPGMLWLLARVPHYGRWFRFWQFWVAYRGRMHLTGVDPEWPRPGSVSEPNERLRKDLVAHLAAQTRGRPDLLAKVTPAYPPAAKRMLRDNGAYLAAMRRDNAELITEAIREITPAGVITGDGREHPADVIVFATGFRATQYLAPMRVTGRSGVDLHDWWAGDARAYLGITVPGFPNLFMASGPNTGTVVIGNAVFFAERAAEYAVAAAGRMLASGHRSMEVCEDVYWRHGRMVDEESARRAWGAGRASGWYVNDKGRVSQVWPLGLLEYWNLTRDADPDDYLLR